MAHIFICYSRADTVEVDKLAQEIEKAGYVPWIDRGSIGGGDIWDERTAQAILECDAFIVILSPNAIQSDNVKDEINFARDNEKRIIPVRIKPVKLPASLHLRLARFQIVDIEKTTGLEMLMDSLRGIKEGSYEPQQGQVYPSGISKSYSVTSKQANDSETSLEEFSQGKRDPISSLSDVLSVRPSARKYLLVMIAVVVLFTGYILSRVMWLGQEPTQEHAFTLPEKPEQESFVFLMTPFWGLDEETREEGKVMQVLITRAIIEALDEEEGIEIISEDVESRPRSDLEARRLGDSLKADIVVWGEVLTLRGDVEITSHITNISGSLDSKRRSANTLRTSSLETNQLSLRNKNAEEVRNLALLALSMYHRRNGQYAEALDLISKIKPTSLESTTEYGRTLLFSGKEDEAEKVLKDGLEKYSNSPSLMALLAELYWYQDKLELALSYQQKASIIEPENQDHYYGLIRLYQQLEEYDQAFATISRAREMDPREPSWLHLLGSLYTTQGNPDEALEAYIEAIELDPSEARSYQMLGDFYNEQGNYSDALAAYERAIELNPDDPWLYFYLGIFLDGQDNDNKAREMIHKAVEIAPDNSWLYFLVGEFFNKQGNYSDALAAYERAIELDPNEAYYYDTLGNVYRYMGNFDKAIKAFLSAIKIAPRVSGYYWSLGHAYMDKGQYDEAISEFNRAIALDPKDVHLLRNLGRIYRNNGDYDRAILTFHKALELDSTNAYTHNALGLAYYLQGAFNEAAQRLKAAVSLEPEHLEFKLDYAVSLLRSGQALDSYDFLSISSESLDESKSDDAWRLPIIRFYLGQISETELRDLAEKSMLTEGEAYYFIGMGYLLNFGRALDSKAPDSMKARSFFQKSLEYGPHTYRLLTRTELRRLE